MVFIKLVKRKIGLIMKRIKVVYLIVLCQFATYVINAQIQNLPALVKNVDPSIIKIYTINSKGEYERQGTGVIISSDGVAISNFHVLVGAKKAIAIDYFATTYEISKVIDYSDNNDLIKFQLTTNGKITSPVGYSVSNLEKGMNVFSLGFPNGFEMTGGSTVSTGIISGFRQVDGQDLIQTTAPITHGSSGGGLFDESGKLCGITSGTFASDIKDRHANLNKVISISDIKKLTRSLNLTLSNLYDIVSNDNLFILAMEAYESNDYETGIYYFIEHLKIFPDDAVAWFRLGNCFNQIGRKNIDIDILNKSIICFNNAIDLDNTYYHAYYQGSLVYLMLGELNLAFDYAENAFRIAPKVPITSYVLGKCYSQQKNYSKAVDYFTRAITIGASAEILHQWYLERAIAYGWMNESALAENDYKKCIELNSSNQDCLFYYSNYLLLHERNSEACTYLNNLFKINPNYSNGGNSVIDYLKALCN